MKNNKIHCKSIGDGFWKVFITEDSWDTFSFIMRSKTQPTEKEVKQLWQHESVHAKQMERVI